MVEFVNTQGVRYCPICGSKTEVDNTKDMHGKTRRYRQCVNDACQYRYNTDEVFNESAPEQIDIKKKGK